MNKPSRMKAMKAKCRDCCADYADGRKDCGVRKCALYYWMPYRKQEPDISWEQKTSKPSNRILSAEHKRKLAEGREASRNQARSDLETREHK